MAAIHREPRSRTRSITLWVVAGIVALLLFLTLWVAIRALMARDALLGAVPIARSVATSVLSADGDISGDVADMQQRARTAASLTSDPIWRAVEIVPLLGSNLTAFREAAAMVEDVADGALPPLSELASTFNLQSLAPVDGRFDLATFAAAGPLLGQARESLDDAALKAEAIDTENTIDQIGEAVDQLIDLVDEAKTVVGGLDTAVELLPPMLGADGDRSYLLLSLNNSELRATGGIPGALAVVNASNGKLSLGETSSASDLGRFDDPVLPLTESEVTLYQEILGRYMQDVNFTPDFARTGQLASAMWEERTGQSVDGVIALDPVALSYILSATGPINAGAGIELTTQNAASFLLSEVYSRFEDPNDQDTFFAAVTGRIFGAVTSGATDTPKLLTALTQGANENRIHLWSAAPDEQALIDTTPLVGALPENTETTSGFGVYFNDGTGAKMDYYLKSGIGIAAGDCRNDKRPLFDVRVQLSSTAPTDAADSLPAYVTGDGLFGIEPGNIKTAVYVYAPSGSLAYNVTIDGQPYSFVTTEHDGRTVAGIDIQLEPGQSVNLGFQFLGAANDPTAVSLQHTPMASLVQTSLDNYLDCDAVQIETDESTRENSDT